MDVDEAGLGETCFDVPDRGSRPQAQRPQGEEQSDPQQNSAANGRYRSFLHTFSAVQATAGDMLDFSVPQRGM